MHVLGVCVCGGGDRRGRAERVRDKKHERMRMTAKEREKSAILIRKHKELGDLVTVLNIVSLIIHICAIRPSGP